MCNILEGNSGAGSITPRHILLVEDDLFLGELLVSALRRYRDGDCETVKVSWFVRARMQAAPDGGMSLVLMDPDGHEFFFSERRFSHSKLSGPELSTEPTEPIDFAFVDYRLKSSALTGLEVTRKLTASGVKVIACSGLPWLNDEMIKAGAKFGLEKDKIFSRAISESDFLDQICSLLQSP